MEQLLSRLPFPSNARSVGIELNPCDYRMPETGAVSDPRVVEPLLAGVRSRYPNSDVFVHEYDANSTIARTLFAYTAIDKIATC